MKITLTFTPAELKRFKEKELRVVVIDVLRASSTITHAFSQGCEAIYTFASIKACLQRARELGRDKVILGGERRGIKLGGFQLGNSPLEYSREVVEGKSILFTTTNCTKNLLRLRRIIHPGQTQEVLICSFLNLPEVVEYLATRKGRLHIALSGEEGEVAIEDTVCGGMLIHRLLETADLTEADLSDSARLAHIAYLCYKDNLHQALLHSTRGQLLLKLGVEKDFDFYVRVGLYPIIPRFSDGVIKLEKHAGCV